MTLYKNPSLIPRRQEKEADVEEAVQKYEVQEAVQKYEVQEAVQKYEVQEKQVVEKEEVAKEAQKYQRRTEVFGNDRCEDHV